MLITRYYEYLNCTDIDRLMRRLNAVNVNVTCAMAKTCERATTVWLYVWMPVRADPDIRLNV